MKYFKIGFLLILALFLQNSSFGASYTIEGQIKDNSGYSIPMVAIQVEENNASYLADYDGNYKFSLPEGKYHIRFSFTGFKSETKEILLNKNLTMNLVLIEDVKILDEAVISYQRKDKNIEKVEMSTNNLDIEEIKKMPAFLGEVDIVKSVQLLPGVSTVGEGASGFNVRGGNIDQNLILFDNSPVYSSSHLFGFFSVFNSDVVSGVKLFKGGIPAEYGGRISSVLDVGGKSASVDKFKASGGIGLVSSRLTLEVPVVKNKLSVLVGGRRSYFDLFFPSIPEEVIQKSAAYFYDLNTKIQYSINDKNKVTFSAYRGSDAFNINGTFGFKWNNSLGNLTWYHTINDSSTVKSIVSFSQYDYGFFIKPIFKWDSKIQNIDAIVEWHKKLKDHDLKIGIHEKMYYFSPASVNPYSNEGSITFEPFTLDLERSLESGIYIGDEYKFNTRVSVLGGLRFSDFLTFGPGTSYQYDPNLPKDYLNVIDTIKYDNNQVMNHYYGLEPRLGIRYKLDSTSSVKLGYNLMRQYLHLISNSTGGLPFDVWKSSDENIKPLKGHQLALGYFKNFKDNTFEFSSEIYYKWMIDIVDYKDNADLLINPYLEAELLTGIGKSYGLELMLKKASGKFTGWVSYTLSRSFRKVASSEFRDETINNGNWYPSNYDKPHDLTIVLAYDITNRLSVSSNFTYSTGRPITYPDSKFTINDRTYWYYPYRNQERVPDYHRLDLSITYKGKEKVNRKWYGEWVLSVYNVYARKNAFSVSFSEDEFGKPIANQTAILGTLFPSITYNFKFN